MDGGRCTNQSRTRTSRGERQKYRDRVHLERRIARLYPKGKRRGTSQESLESLERKAPTLG